MCNSVVVCDHTACFLVSLYGEQSARTLNVLDVDGYNIIEKTVQREEQHMLLKG